jgi:Heterokaryon incompatibility protein Het-C
VLRNDLSTIGGDAAGDEGAFYAYRISLIDFASTPETVFADYTSKNYSGPLSVKYPEFQAEIKKLHNESTFKDDQKDGELEFFGAGRGEHFKEKPESSFGHQSIEDVLIEAGFDKDLERRQIYFGNWLRDFSQMIDPAITRKPGAPQELPRLLTRKQITELVRIKASVEFVKEQGEAHYFQLTEQTLGVYRPVEHIDNPKNFKNEDPRTIDPDFAEPVPITSELLGIDPETSMKRYIMKSADYMVEQLNLAAKNKKTPSGLRHFGAALHVLEDYFAHTNFVELSLIKMGYKDVLTWTAAAHCKHIYPVVTGMFDTEDALASTAGIAAELLFPVEWEYKRTKPKERTPADRATLVILSDKPKELKTYMDYLAARDVWASQEWTEPISKAMHYTLGMYGNSINFVFSSITQLLGNSIDDAQTETKGYPGDIGSTDPSHSQLAKDHDTHAFMYWLQNCQRKQFWTLVEPCTHHGMVTPKPILPVLPVLI